MYFVHPANVGTVYTRTSIEQLGVQTDGDSAVTNRGVFDSDFGSGCVSSDSSLIDFTQHKEFDLSYYPFERHTLVVQLVSKFSTDHILLTALDSEPASGIMLGGFSYTTESWTCTNNTMTATLTSRGGVPLDYATVVCSIEATHVDASWPADGSRVASLEGRASAAGRGELMATPTVLPPLVAPAHALKPIPLLDCRFLKDYTFFIIVMTTSLISTLATARRVDSFATYRASLNTRSSTYTGLTLSYLFALKPMPYGGGLDDFAGNIPISWCVYTMGLLTLAIMSLQAYGLEYALGSTEAKERPKVYSPGAEGQAGRGDADDKAVVKQLNEWQAKMERLDLKAAVALHALCIGGSVVMLIVASASY